MKIIYLILFFINLKFNLCIGLNCFMCDQQYENYCDSKITNNLIKYSKVKKKRVVNM